MEDGELAISSIHKAVEAPATAPPASPGTGRTSWSARRRGAGATVGGTAATPGTVCATQTGLMQTLRTLLSLAAAVCLLPFTWFLTRKDEPSALVAGAVAV